MEGALLEGIEKRRGADGVRRRWAGGVVGRAGEDGGKDGKDGRGGNDGKGGRGDSARESHRRPPGAGAESGTKPILSSPRPPAQCTGGPRWVKLRSCTLRPAGAVSSHRRYKTESYRPSTRGFDS